LKLSATSPSGPGIPAKLHTSSKIVDVNEGNASITLQNGTIVQGDIVIGSDGVHSITRSKIGPEVKPFGSGKSAFRFLISRQVALDDPVTSKFVQKSGELIIWYDRDRRVVMYPTSDNQILNFVCIHPEALSETGNDTWNSQGNIERLLDIYRGFDPALLCLLKKVNVSDIKVWKLLDMDVLPTWVKGRLALLGDAAHPFLPHQGQGGGVAIEDAASLAVVLERSTPKEEITVRLELYEKIRINRANRIQELSRIAGKDLNENIKLDSKPSDFQVFSDAESYSARQHKLQFRS